MCGGDLYEHDRFTPDTVAFVRSVFAQLYPLPVFVSPGNHDWLGPASLYAQADWSPNVHVFQEARLAPLSLCDGLTLWGAAHRAPANTNGFLDGFAVDRGGIHIALFHGSEQGALPFQEQGKVPHAPFRFEQISAAGLHHALLGHFHRPRGTGYSTYPGNPDPLAFGEDGQRGAVLIEVQPNGSVTQDWREVAPRTMRDLEIDVSGCASQQDVRDRLNAGVAGFDGFVRVTLTGDLDPDVDLAPLTLELKQSLTPCVVLRTGGLKVAYDLDLIKLESTVRGQFVRDVLTRSDLDYDLRQHVLITGCARSTVGQI